MFAVVCWCLLLCAGECLCTVNHNFSSIGFYLGVDRCVVVVVVVVIVVDIIGVVFIVCVIIVGVVDGVFFIVCFIIVGVMVVVIGWVS